MRNFARILSAIAVVVFVDIAEAQTIRFVTNAADTGTGSLRDALATCTPTPCEVRFNPTVFAPPTTIVLATGLTVPNDVIIDGFTGIGSPNTAAFPAPDNALRKVTLAAACTGCTAITFPAANTIPSGVKGLIIQGFSTGIFIQGSQAKVTGNWIRGNTNGVVISGATSTQLNYIGGQLAADRNIIGGNSSVGIQVTGTSVINTNIDGNFIGTGPSGTSADANGTGVSVSGAAGTAIGDVVGNLITGNGTGVSVGASTVPSTIRRNLIGITGLGNSSVGLQLDANQTITEFNSFRSNVGDAVRVNSGTGNIIRDNIYESNGLPIDLQAFTNFDGPTPNDDGTGDSDAGGNNIQNYPAIQAAYYDPQLDMVTVTFAFNSVSAASNSYVIALHKAEPTGTNPGSLQLVGSQCFAQKVFAPNTTFFFGTGLAVGDRIVMTATGYADTACPTPSIVADGTSEFSPVALVTLQPGVVTNTSDSGPGSLRQAILDANSGVCPFTGCTVTFAIPTTDPGYNAAAGTWTIQPATEYPPLTRGDLYFDGDTQASFIGGDPNPAGPEIVINGSLLASPFANGFQVLASTAHVQFVEFEHLVINGFADNAIVFQGSSATAESRNHAVRRCYIGTNASGTAAVPNGTGIAFGPFARINKAGTGISIPAAVAKSSASSVSTSGGNVISGNSGPGVLISHGTNNTVQGNLIGTDATGAFPLPNAIGVKIQGFMATGNKVGGDPFWAENNTIAFNTGSGIEVNTETTGHWFDRNNIHGNGGLGIDLMPAGPTPNDVGDADTGANDLTNFPVITSVTYGASDTTVSGTMNGLPGATFEIQVFSSAAPDPSGFGEGQTYQASAIVTTDISGNATWSTPAFSGIHRWVSATATYQPSALPRVTSEFSAVFNTAPVGVADTFSTNEDVVLTVPATGVLGNDTDADGDPLTAVLVTGPASGSLTFNPDGSFTYTPVANFNGPVTFTYMPNDGLANGNTTTVTINVIAVNDPPVAAADAFA
ncbi:MAG TPA: Ig-like domain-containing protein, partial [Thermoanaerobaculia bacterium]|nr:Ig-like domain-containing protein [Thermoanaerobaculia bacterium]